MNRYFKLMSLLLVLTFLGCASGPRAKRREAVKGLQDDVNKFKKVAADVVNLKKSRADDDVKFGELKDEFQLLNARIEEFQHFSKKNEEKLDGVNERLDKIISDYDKRVRNLEEQNQSALEKLEKMEKRLDEDLDKLISKIGKISSAKKKASAAQTDVKYDYVNGMKKYRAKEYSRAITYFTRYIKNFPAGRNIHNSRFFLAQAYNQKRDYQNAILKFEEYKEKFPRGKKVAEVIYLQGKAFLKLGKKSDAKLFFSEVVSGHAESSYAQKAKSELDKL